jgi:hypothetical protein
MQDLVKETLKSLSQLTFWNIVQIFMLAPIGILTYLIWWGTQNPESTIQVLSGERIIGSVSDCLLLESWRDKKRYYRLTLNIGSDVSVSAGSFNRWEDRTAIEQCDRLLEIRENIKQKIR